jgi:ribulose-phosphate 3-epimerase
MEPIIAPSLLSANFSDLASAVEDINRAGAEWVHFDVADGIFVPNLTYGPKLVSDLRPKSSLIFDVHLMVQSPENLVDTFIKAGADNITFHAEACLHIHRLLTAIRSGGKKAGISIIPSTGIACIEESLPFADSVLVMTVNPGFSGQVMIPECLDKVRKLARIRQERGLSFRIAVDGGVNGANAGLCREAGADVLVSGSMFFDAADKAGVVRALKTGNKE